MKTPEYNRAQQEQKEYLNTKVLVPATESLIKEDKSDSLWPENIKNNPELEHQAKLRRELLSSFDEIFDILNKTKGNVTESIDSGEITEDKAFLMYQNLSKFISEDRSNSRILLYLPFEVIPSKDWHPDSENLAECVESFIEIYTAEWNNLLSVHDVRTNFNDGDTHESLIDENNIPRVSKAAHFIPILLQKGLISKDQIFAKFKQTDDAVLRESIADTFEYMAETGLLSASDIQEMENSEDSLLSNMAVIIKSKDSFPDARNKNNEAGDLNWLETLSKKIEDEKKEKEIALSKKANKLSESRIKWEEQKNQTQTIEKYGDEIAFSLSSGLLSAQDLKNFIQDNPRSEVVLPSLLAIGKHIENTASKNIGQAKNEYAVFQDLIENILQSKEAKNKDTAQSILSRLCNIKVLEKSYLEEFGINIPKFDEDFAERKHQLRGEISLLQKQTAAIENREELKQSIYPVSILFGSKIKGYASTDSDTDFAVFVKPGVRVEDRKHIQEMISQNFGNKALEFWLKENEGNLSIQDFENPDMSLGDSRLVSVLFEGVWCGQNAAMKELYEKLLTPYLNLKESNRVLLLEELERNALQYRLMHRGYSRFYPPEKSSLEQKENDMDMKSTFWDPGYRRLATKLFIKKVFLPKI